MNHEPPKSGIPKRKKTEACPRLSCKIEYLLTSNHRDQSTTSEYFTDDQIGAAEELYLHPATRFVATFLGDANLIESTVIDIGMDRLTLGVDGSRWDIATSERHPAGANVLAVVRPEAIRLSETEGNFKGRVVTSTYLGAKAEYLVRVGDQTLQVVQPNPTRGSRFAEGAEVGVSLPHAYVHILKDA